MSLAANDILELKAFSTYMGKDCLNVFYYRVDDAPFGQASLGDFAKSWETKFATDIMVNLSNGVNLNRVLVTNLTNGVNFADVAADSSGAVAGDSLPPFNALGFKLLRSTILTRSGAKRFPGIAEASQEYGIVNYDLAAQTLMEGFMAGYTSFESFNYPLETYSMMNVIVGRSLVDGHYVLDLTRVNPVWSCKMTAAITSQTTRKS